MTGNSYDYCVERTTAIRSWAAPKAAGPTRRMKSLALFMLLVSAGGIQAQPGPMNAGNPYAQGYPPMANPYPYSQPMQPAPYANGSMANPYPSSQPMQPAPYANGYYGNNYPRPNYAPSNGNGVTYYYVQNPNGPNYYPFASPYGSPAPAGRVPVRAPAWPAPDQAPQLPIPVFIDPSWGDPALEGRKPIVSFHRKPDECFWFNADYLGTFVRPMRTPPLVTLGSVANAAPGALGQPSTTVVFGNNGIDFGLLSGVRMQGGLFLDPCDRFSVDLGGFMNFPSNQSFTLGSDAGGNPLISRPIINTPSGQEGGVLTSAPGFLAGTVSIASKSEMAGLELNLRYHDYVRERLHIDGLVGFRYLRLAERLRIQDQITPLAPDFLTFQGASVNAPNSLADEDTFRTVNQFFGPQIGGRLSWEYRWITLESFAKLGLGITQEQTTINGSTTLITPNGNQTAVGGILAQPSNIGTYNRAVFGIVPEFGFQLGVEVTPCIRLQMGYSLLMWNRVVRPGNQIDRNINQGQVPGSPAFGTVTGPLAPTYRFNDEYFWSNTFNVGLEFHF